MAGGSWGSIRIGQPPPVAHLRTQADAQGLVDTVVKGNAVLRPLADVETLTDAANTPGSRRPIDALNIVDTPVQSGVNTRLLVDALAGADAVSPVKNGTSTTRTVADALGITDPGGGLDLAEQLTDALGMADSPVPAGGTGSARFPADALGIADAALRQAHQLTGSDPLDLTDNPVAVGGSGAARAPADALGLTDAASPALTSGGTSASRTPTDPLGIADATLRQTHQLTGADALGITDAVDRGGVPSVPAGLAATNLTASGFDLTWSPSTDDAGVTGYEIAVLALT